MPLTTVTNTTKIFATGVGGQSGYNDVRNTLVDILSTGTNGYGYQSIPSFPITTSDTISAAHWLNLVDDVSRVYQHLNNSTPTITDQPVSGSTIQDGFVNQLIGVLNTSEPNRYNRPPVGQRSAVSQSSQWTVDSPSRTTWGSLIEHEVTMTWSNELSTRYFFNLGGRLSFNLAYPVEPYSADDLVWKNIIDANTASIAAFAYSRADYVSGTPKVFTTGTGNTITATITKVNSQTINMLLSVANTTAAVDLAVTNNFVYEYSTGALTAPQPIVTVQKSLGDVTVPVVVPTKILTVSTPALYSWITGQTSAAQTVSITNNGNSTATVSSITFDNAVGITAVTDFTGLGGTTNFTLNPAQTKTFTLAYTGTAIGGPYNSSFTVNSNNDAGAITRLTSQTVNAVPFSITVTPSAVTDSHLGLTTWLQPFVISSVNGDSFSYSSVLSTPNAPPGSTGWTVDNSPPAGPTLRLSPIGTTATSYTATVSLVVTAVSSATAAVSTATVPVSVTLSLPSSQNLGTWLSSLGPDNAVIGMSYDIINSERYLTIGIGMGADGSVPLSVGGIGNINVANLGINADPDFKQGQPQFAVTDVNSRSSQFLKNFGVWPNTVPRLPVNWDVGLTTSYRFYIPTTGTYNYEYSSDDDSVFRFIPTDQYGIIAPGTMPINLPNQLFTGGAESNWRRSYTGSITLNQGWYILNYYHVNYGVHAAAAFQITNNSGEVIWNTRYPVRSSSPYLYWQEVLRIRIPTDGTEREILSNAWYVKNSYQVSNKTHWGYYFTPDMFKVVDDGFGNLNIVLFGSARAPVLTDPNAASDTATIKSLSAAFYYYLPPSVLMRYSNLDPGPVGDGTQTRYFSGFDAAGNVITVLQSIPASIPNPPPIVTGGGGGGGGGGGLFDEFTNINEV